MLSPFRLKPMPAVLATLLCVFASAAQAQTRMSVRLDWIAGGLYAPFFLALDKGWFKEKGLDVTIDDGNGSANAISLVGANQYDIGHANLSAMILARNKGVPVISVGQVARKSDIGVLVPENSGWKTPKDLEGKTVVLTPGGFADPFMGLFMQHGGSSRDKIKILTATASAKDSMYLSGQADAVVTSVPFEIPVYASVRPSRGILFSDYDVPLPSFGLIVSEERMAKDPQSIGAFVQTYFKALDYVFGGHEDEAAAAILKSRPNGRYAPELIRAQIDAYRDYFARQSAKDPPSGWHSPEEWEKIIHLMTDAGLLPNPLKATDYYTNRFIAAAGH